MVLYHALRTERKEIQKPLSFNLVNIICDDGYHKGFSCIRNFALMLKKKEKQAFLTIFLQ